MAPGPKDLLTELREANCVVASDRVAGDQEMTDFKRRARLAQARWRERNGFTASGYRHHAALGSYLSPEEAKAKKLNFLSDKIREAVEYRSTHKEKFQQFEESRLYSNLLSSMPMCFNLFGEFWEEPERATAALRAWIPDVPGNVEAVRFEWSPGRDDASYLNNRSAFDAAFLLTLPNGRKGIVGVETKYHEHAMVEEIPKGDKLLRYVEIAEQSGAFTRQWPKAVLGTELQQIWLDHLLALSMTLAGKEWEWARFLLVYPSGNTSFARAGERYSSLLTDASTFQVTTLEQLLDANVLPAQLERDFRDRYLW